MKSYSKQLILSVILIFSIPLACSIPTFGQIPTATPEPTQPVVALPTIDLDDIVATDTSTGNMVITVTEAQLSQMVAEKMADDPSPMLSQPMVTLQNEQIGITGKTLQAGMNLDVKILVSVDVDVEGQPVMVIDSIKIGPMEAPTAIRDLVSNLMFNMFNTAIGSGPTGKKIDSVRINNGLMVVNLRPN